MGRKPTGKFRTRIYPLLFTTEERARAKALADAHGVTLAAWIRGRSLLQPFPAPRPARIPSKARKSVKTSSTSDATI